MMSLRHVNVSKYTILIIFIFSSFKLGLTIVNHRARRQVVSSFAYAGVEQNEGHFSGGHSCVRRHRMVRPFDGGYGFVPKIPIPPIPYPLNVGFGFMPNIPIPPIGFPMNPFGYYSYGQRGLLSDLTGGGEGYGGGSAMGIVNSLLGGLTGATEGLLDVKLPLGDVPTRPVNLIGVGPINALFVGNKVFGILADVSNGERYMTFHRLVGAPGSFPVGGPIQNYVYDSDEYLECYNDCPNCHLAHEHSEDERVDLRSWLGDSVVHSESDHTEKTPIKYDDHGVKTPEANNEGQKGPFDFITNFMNAFFEMEKKRREEVKKPEESQEEDSAEKESEQVTTTTAPKKNRKKTTTTVATSTVTATTSSSVEEESEVTTTPTPKKKRKKTTTMAATSETTAATLKTTVVTAETTVSTSESTVATAASIVAIAASIVTTVASTVVTAATTANISETTVATSAGTVITSSPESNSTAESTKSLPKGRGVISIRKKTKKPC